ncbi:MAG: hypothetical protein ABSE63_14660 [Thermoguttaceae bacterium]
MFISPLVGAGAVQSLLIYRNFTRRGSILLSFEYRGHAQSTGTFEFDKTITDVRDALIWSWNYANQRGLPLHGFAACFGTIPLLAQFGNYGCGYLLQSVSTVSGLFHLNQVFSIADSAIIFSRYYGRQLSAEEFSQGIAENRFDWNGDIFRQALLEYLTGVFPELRIGLDFFEELPYRNVRIQQTLSQLLTARYLEGMQIPADIPCNVFVGRNDDIMSLQTAEGRRVYAEHVRSIVPHAEIHEREFDHFGRGIEHDMVIEDLCDIFERYDASPVPPPHYQKTVPESQFREPVPGRPPVPNQFRKPVPQFQGAVPGTPYLIPRECR